MHVCSMRQKITNCRRMSVKCTQNESCPAILQHITLVTSHAMLPPLPSLPLTLGTPTLA